MRIATKIHVIELEAEEIEILQEVIRDYVDYLDFVENIEENNPKRKTLQEFLRLIKQK